MPESLAEIWEPVRLAVEKTYWAWTFHHELCGDARFADLMKDHHLLGSFALISDSLLKAIIMRIGTILDKPTYRVKGVERKNLSFEQLIISSKEHNDEAKDSEWLAELDSIRIHFDSITLLRNWQIGHTDLEATFRTELGVIPPVDALSVRDGLEMLKKLLIRIFEHFNGTAATMEFSVSTGEAGTLLDLIRRGKDSQDAELYADLPSAVEV